jgi:pimeloyl-ACP methyl ester carboxylesterase
MAAKEGFQAWRNKAGEIIGWKLPATVSPTGSVLVVHGNAGCALNRGYIARPVHEAAARDVYVLEYPGYGARAGSPGMKSFLAAGEEAFALLPDTMPIHLVSESLGAGVASHLAMLHGDRVSGLMMFAPYNNLASVGRRQMPFLPVRLILRDRFNPAEWLKDYRGPVSIVLAGSDEVIPSDLGRKLYDGYAGPKRLQVIEGAHHNDIAEQSPAWWKDKFSFWEQNRH